MYWIANLVHPEVMTVILALIGLLALAAILVALGRTIASDGFGSNPTPRSHPEEVGSWITQQHSR